MTMKILPLVFVSVVIAGLIGVAECAPAALAQSPQSRQTPQSPRFIMGPNTWARDPGTGLARRSGYNQLAPLAVQNVPSGKTVSVQNMTGINFAQLPKHAPAASQRPAYVNSVVTNPTVFGKPNAVGKPSLPASAKANSLRPGLPMTASPILATKPARGSQKISAQSAHKANNAGRNVIAKRIEKLPAARNYAQGAGFVSGPTAPVLYGTNRDATTHVGGKLLPKH